jgi:hypothetical protein
MPGGSVVKLSDHDKEMTIRELFEANKSVLDAQGIGLPDASGIIQIDGVVAGPENKVKPGQDVIIISKKIVGGR